MSEPSIYPELDNQLAEVGDPDAAAAFVIDSPDAANWAIRKIAVHAKRVADAEAFAQREVDRISLYLAGEREQAEQSTSFLAGRLRRYHEDRLAEQGIDVHSVDRGAWEKARDKTIKLPAGELVARKQPDVWDLDDETVLEWAEANGWQDVIRRRDPEVDRPALKRTFHVAPGGSVIAPDGEVVPGITVTEGDLSFKVKPRVVD